MLTLHNNIAIIKVYKISKLKFIKEVIKINNNIILNENIILSENINLNATAKDWVEAMRLSGQLLVNSNYITKGYIDLTIKTVEEYGPYIVIIPGLALSHSRPDVTVLKTGISLLSLSKPVHFNCENDPVDIVITLAAVNDTDHLGLLSKLSDYLSEEENMDFIRNCTDPEALARELNKSHVE
ncbi:PTS sugar transporter subunit IIA [Clostridium estertheticum]|uniref:PTS sugar transporter subunit IIA n=1 Tax=Clostridium estertheticum TaxID=238834 RepID=UPI001C7D9C05|nr:PTS sugar transporter subunit IIA [Clostridium estertheticum]MBX4261175.1 PTS sugar transporter subunit IIA [Clostridium estertheticum]WLC71893.1 PTS sugar transporter subunit IIA [Clostridium estertheticum]